MPRSRTALSVKHPRHAATRNRRTSHTAAPEFSNPHNVAPVPRGLVLGRFPYAGPVPHARSVTAGVRKPSPLQTFEGPIDDPRSGLSAPCGGGWFAPILRVPGQSEPSGKRPLVPIARLLPHGDRRAAQDKVASNRISPNLMRNGSVALARRWGDRRRKSLRISHAGLQKVAGFSVAFSWTAGPPTGRHSFRMLISRAGRRCSSRYSRYGISTSSIHFMNARTRRDRLLRCATTRDTASARRRKSGMISTSAPLSRYRPIPRSGA